MPWAQGRWRWTQSIVFCQPDSAALIFFFLTFTGNAPYFKLQATRNLVKYWSYSECLNVVDSHYHISTCNSTVWFQFYKDKFLNAHTIASMNLPYIVVPYLAMTIQTSFTTSRVNMVTPITTCTKEEQGAAIWFLWAEINQRLWPQYGDSVLPQWSKYEWNGMLKNDRKSIIDKNDQGTHPHQLLKGTLNKSACWFLTTGGWLLNWQTNCRLATVMSMKSPTRLRFWKVCARWVPNQLVEQHTHNRLKNL